MAAAAPVILGAAMSGGMAAAMGTTIFGLTVAQSAMVIFAANIALGMVSQALAPKPKVPNFGSFEVQARDRLQQFRQPITVWRTIYGEGRFSGPLTYLASTGSNQYLHMIITLTHHAIHSMDTLYFNDIPIPLDGVDADGNVTTGQYAGFARIQYDLGTTGGQPFPDLVAETADWTDAHRQEGCAKLYLRLKYDRDTFANGVPSISVWTKGKKVLDARTSTIAWTSDPAACIRDYLVTSTTQCGYGATTLEIDDTFTVAATNTSEEIVSTTAISVTVNSVSTSTNMFTVAGSTTRFMTGDQAVLTTTASAPGGITAGTAYYVIPVQRQGTVRCKLASTYAAALAGTAVSVTSQGDGTQALIKTGEPRYTLNGMIEHDRRPADIIGEMLTAMGGRAIYASGVWRLLAAAYASPSWTIDEGDVVSPIQVQTKLGRRDRFNAVKGIYVTTLNKDQPADYPPVTNATYEAQDNNERRFRELDLPMTNRPHAAQRLAKVELERHRQMITVQLTTNLRGLQVQAGDTVALTNTRFGWSSKVFEVISWRMTNGAELGVPLLGCTMTLRETAAAVFDWNSGEETTVDPAPNTSLPALDTVTAPANLVITESLYDTRESAGVKARATVSWYASPDGFVENYRVEYKLSSASTWTQLPLTADTSIRIDDIDPGTYDFRVKAFNFLRKGSAWVTKAGKEIRGLLDPPTEPQNLTISAIGGFAMLRWDLSSDLDVRIGGKITFRHCEALTGATWETSVSIGKSVQGGLDYAVLPLKEGTYLAKAVDSSGVESLLATAVTTKQATVVAFTDLSTITENPAFTGTKTNVFLATDSAPFELELVGSSLVDDIPDIDSVANWDAEGGIVSEGTYLVSQVFDFGSVVPRRLTTHIKATIVNELDQIDSRTSPIDDWDTFDGDTSGAADARVYVAHTDDDPAGTPTWTDWQLLDSAEFSARGAKFKLVMTTTDPAFNIDVQELSITAAQVT